MAAISWRRTELMHSSAASVAAASASWTSDCTRFTNLPKRVAMKMITGMIETMIRLSFHETQKIIPRAIKAWMIPRTNMEMFTVSADCITWVSALSRLMSSPVRLVSKKPVSCATMLP